MRSSRRYQSPHLTVGDGVRLTIGFLLTFATIATLIAIGFVGLTFLAALVR